MLWPKGHLNILKLFTDVPIAKNALKPSAGHK